MKTVVNKLPQDNVEALRRWPRICAHIIAESLGYATPLSAARILLNAKKGQQDWCEWVSACFNSDPRLPVQNAIRRRHYHRGYMADYRLAKKIVEAELVGKGPVFASWF